MIEKIREEKEKNDKYKSIIVRAVLYTKCLFSKNPTLTEDRTEEKLKVSLKDMFNILSLFRLFSLICTSLVNDHSTS